MLECYIMTMIVIIVVVSSSIIIILLLAAAYLTLKHLDVANDDLSTFPSSSNDMTRRMMTGLFSDSSKVISQL